MHASFFTATDDTVHTAWVLYFWSRTWIMEQSGQQCVLHSISTDLRALRERKRRMESICDKWPGAAPGVLVGCVMAEAQVLAAAQAIVICARCCLQGRHLAAASPNIPGLYRVHPQQVCNWISHVTVSLTVFSARCVHLEISNLDMLENLWDEGECTAALLYTLSYTNTLTFQCY